MDPNLVGKASGQSWTATEWLNHAVDKAADAKYGLEGGDDASSACGIRVGGGWSGMAVE